MADNQHNAGEQPQKVRPKKHVREPGKKSATQIAQARRKAEGKKHTPKLGGTGTNNQVDTNICCIIQ